MDFGASHICVTVQVEVLGSTPVAVTEFRLCVQSQGRAHGTCVRLTCLINLVGVLLPDGDLISLNHHSTPTANIKNRVNGCLKPLLQSHPLHRHQILFLCHLASVGPRPPILATRTGIIVSGTRHTSSTLCVEHWRVVVGLDLGRGRFYEGCGCGV